ncbi:MAG: hypothetical protein SOT34_00445 [Candidatus Borkfalkiaceae bacterium]|nr:hypothetical protein [Christensenellaceae bacterium]
MSEIMAAMIALIGVLVSVGISFIISKATQSYNYKSLYANTVSGSRNEWLNEMRGFISVMLSEIQSDQSNANGRTKEYFKARDQILLRLNLNEAKHKMLEEQIRILDGCSGSKNETIEKIVIISRHILKEEWEKVKKEAKGE